MRKRGRTDANQTPIVEGLRKIEGVSVWVTSGLGNGFPDLVVGYQRRNYLLEVKNPLALRGNSSRLTDEEQDFHDAWQGQVAVVESLEDARRRIGLD